jgi:hypothetical protein
MRRIFLRRSKRQVRSETTFIAFFFNARGTDLEKTPKGLYRTLVHQLLKRSEATMKTYLPIYLEKESSFGKENIHWHKGELSQLFFSIVSGPEISPLEVFVDALDECEDDEVRQVVELFEKSAREAIRNQKSLKICWSSRHYPHISLDNKLEIQMENENTPDIRFYVESEFRLEDEDELTEKIRKEIIRKASGVFLWTVLVIRSPLKAWDQGFRPHEIWELLIHLPSELERLYENILKTLDQDRKEQSLRLWQIFCTHIVHWNLES